VEADPFAWTDRSCTAIPNARSVPEDRACVERDSTPDVAVGDATVWALCGLIFASVAAGRRDPYGHAGVAGGNPP
jgi:hypothetical protein